MFNCEERTDGRNLYKLKSCSFGQDDNNLRVRYLKFIERLQKDPTMTSKFDF